MKCRRIIYTSQSTKQFNKRDLLDLLHDSRAFNTMDNISGVLMHKNGLFLQIIEGKSKDLENLIERLRRDTRHNNLKIIDDQSIEDRTFANWSMGCADFDDPTLSLIPGIRTDLSAPTVINNLITNLPELVTLLLQNND
ncbi:BLUF domain-containing protein [Olleya sp. HaHaR_3_96]|uniref:BLUF domain-containing protein n=1 Tax=Olleya sp. HaHaR_3_96 TaxID=2745560 RepID=UPI001C4E52F0|nr:BLUF domain-containing protein [Olleya sp. HaHaR_3_96]QXP59637.1 BLUF domain-containing protein [Olleya sp. HaHaR_3_96]